MTSGQIVSEELKRKNQMQYDSTVASHKSELNETEDFVKYLLAGSGSDVNYESLRNELEGSISSRHSPKSHKLKEALLEIGWILPSSLDDLAEHRSDLNQFLTSAILDYGRATQSKHDAHSYVHQLKDRIKILEAQLSHPKTHDPDLSTKISRLATENKSLKEKITSADSQLLDLKSKHLELANEAELMRLELLNRPLRIHGSTRDLIKSDKLTFKNENHILASIMVQLGIKSPHHIPATLDRICDAIKLIPQLKRVI